MNKSQHFWQCCLFLMHITSLNYSVKKKIFLDVKKLREGIGKSKRIAEYIKTDGVKIKCEVETCVGRCSWQDGIFSQI